MFKIENYNLVPNNSNGLSNQFDFQIADYPASMFHWVEISAFKVLNNDNKKIVLLRLTNKKYFFNYLVKSLVQKKFYFRMIHLLILE